LVRRLRHLQLPPLSDGLNARQGFELSQYRAQLWEFVVEIADAALWLGWLFPANEAL